MFMRKFAQPLNTSTPSQRFCARRKGATEGCLDVGRPFLNFPKTLRVSVPPRANTLCRDKKSLAENAKAAEVIVVTSPPFLRASAPPCANTLCVSLRSQREKIYFATSPLILRASVRKYLCALCALSERKPHFTDENLSQRTLRPQR